MKIYVGHSRQYPYREELYLPLKQSTLNSEYNFILPHEVSADVFNSKAEIPGLSAMIAEVSFPSTSLGIEIGWANMSNVPVLAIYKEGAKVSQAISAATVKMESYNSSEEMLSKIGAFLTQLSK